jgi:glycosyltransferase involved in cell wall biosynthesis
MPPIMNQLMTPLKRHYSRLTVARFRCRQTIIMWLHTTFKTPIGAGLILIGLLLWFIGVKERGLRFVLKGRRVTNIKGANTIIGNLLRRGEGKGNLEPFTSLLIIPQGRVVTSYAQRTLLMKTPTVAHGHVIEKGAIIFKFSETFAPMYQMLDTAHLSKYFRIILEPSSVGLSSAEILVWHALCPERVIVLAPYNDDFNFLTQASRNLIPVALGPADWVNPVTFSQQEGTDKVYDAIYVANCNPIKRVDRFIRAVARVSRKRPEYRAALVCASHGTARREILETLKWAADKADISLVPGINQRGLNTLFNQAKVNVLLSLREGANKGLAEGLFAGTPALLISECVCGNHRHITPETGLVCRDADLEETLLWFSDHYGQFNPRRWAELNISPIASTHFLSRKLEEIETAEGRIWTTDLLPKVNQPELGYLNPADNWLVEKRIPLLEAFSRGADATSAFQFLQHLHEDHPH